MYLLIYLGIVNCVCLQQKGTECVLNLWAQDAFCKKNIKSKNVLYILFVFVF